MSEMPKVFLNNLDKPRQNIFGVQIVFRNKIFLYAKYFSKAYFEDRMRAVVTDCIFNYFALERQCHCTSAARRN